MPWYGYTRTLAGVPMPLVIVRLETDGTKVEALALIDSGADSSVFNVAIARRLGLRAGDAVPVPMIVADGTTTSAMEWPSVRVSITFGSHRTPFGGHFVDPGRGASFVNLLGREDFLTGVIVQLWNDRRLFNLDASPDAAQDPMGWAR